MMQSLLTNSGRKLTQGRDDAPGASRHHVPLECVTTSARRATGVWRRPQAARSAARPWPQRTPCAANGPCRACSPGVSARFPRWPWSCRRGRVARRRPRAAGHRARSPRCMRFGRACPRGSPAPFARTRARLWGALRGPQNPQRWPWSPRSHTSHFARFASPLTLRADEGTCYGHSRLLAAAGNGRALAGVAGARSPKARFLALVAAGAAVGHAVRR